MKGRRIPFILNIYAMKRFWFKPLLGVFMVMGLGVGMLFSVRQAEAYQDPSVFVTVTYDEPINVRGGPNTTDYPIVGRMFPGDTAPALGVSPAREWVQVSFPSAPGGVGWVYAIYVSVTGELRVVEAPPTATLAMTITIDPTLAAQFNFQPTMTRMPTFTPPPPLTVPQFSETETPRREGIATGIYVAGLVTLGVLGLVVSFIFRK